MKSKFLKICFLFLTASFFSQEISLVKNISTHGFYKDSEPLYLKVHNNKIYFSANDRIHGRELWISDGTENGTNLFKDINAGNNQFNQPLNSVVIDFTTFGSNLIFTANNEIWLSDGTSTGTAMFYASNNDDFSQPKYYTEFNNKLYFSAYTEEFKTELWVTNGTANGTSILKNINTVQNGSSFPESFTVYNNKLYFSAGNSASGKELWVTDGTTQGTVLFKDIFPGAESSSPSGLTVFNNKLFFAARNEENGTELWVSDGTQEGTILLKDIKAGIDNSSPRFFKVFGNQLFFTANDGINGTELWVTDGTEAGTRVFNNIREGASSSNPQYLTVLNDKLYFAATTAQVFSTATRELFESDGTEAGTKKVTQSDAVLNPEYIIALNDKIYFSAVQEENNVGRELFVFDPNASNNNENRTYIPDDNFEQALIDLNLDDELDDYVLTENINTLTTLDIDNKAIADLTGIRDFIALEELNASQNQLTEVNLSNLSNLEIITINLNQLTAINLEGLTNLRMLTIGDNQLTEIDITDLENLEGLSLGFNNLSNANFSSNSLRSFTCMTNNLSSIDISGLPNLTFLNVSRNNLSELDVSSNVNIQTLIANENDLTSLDLSNNENLTGLDVTDNILSSLNVKNGNNQNIRMDGDNRYFYSTNNPNLSCIQVDDVNYATTNFTDIDATSYFGMNCNAQTYIPDDNFEQALIDLGYDTILDDYVLTENINTLTTLDIDNKEIADLTGIQDFIALEDLYASQNQLTEVNLSNLSNLEVAFINQNRITDINLQGLTNLLSLSVSLNQLTEIDITDLENLEGLSLGFNNLSNANFSSNSLRSFTCMNNNLSSVDVSGLPNLTFLNVSRNNLSELDVSSNINIQTLIANENDLTSLDLSSNINLTGLDVTDNILSSLNMKNGNNQNIRMDGDNRYFYATNNPNLSCIQVDDVNYATENFPNIDATSYFGVNCNTQAGLTYVPDDNFEQALIDFGYDDILDDYVLTENINTVYILNISNKSISSLEGIQDFIDMQHLDASFNNLSELIINNARNIITIDVRNNNLSIFSLPITNVQVFHSENNPNLNCIQVNNISDTTHFDFEGNPDHSKDNHSYFSENCADRVHVPDDNFEQALIDLGHDDVLDDYINKSDVEEVTSLDVSNKQIDDLTGIEAFTSVQTLLINNNSIDILDISENTMLTELNCSRNSLDDLNIATNSALVTLNLAFNSIDAIDISNNASLEYFYAAHNNLSTLNTTVNIALKEIVLSYNDIENLDVTTNVNLLLLDVLSNDQSFGQLTEIDLTQNTLLEEVTLQGNLLTEIDLSQNTNLIRLYISDNNLESIDVSTTTQLTTLGIAQNNLTALNLRSLPNLLFFSAQENPLTCISVLDVDLAETRWRANVDINDIFSLSCAERVYVPDDNFEQALIDLGYDDVLDNYIDKSDVENATSLDVSYKRIDVLTGIEAFTSLETLNVSNNSLDELDIYYNTQLTTLNIAMNWIEEIDISNCPLLENFVADHNKFSTVNTSENIALIEIVLAYNEITSLDLTSNVNLVRLNVLSNGQSAGQLTEINLTQNTLLEEVTVQGNLLTSLDLSQNANLVQLYAGNNNLQNITIPENSALSWLNIGSNNLSSLDLRPITGVLSFSAVNNPSLHCVSVNDVPYAQENWAERVDEGVIFSSDCDDFVYVPDDNFEQALIDVNLDDILDNYVLRTNIVDVTSLGLANKNIDNLRGIEAFTNLQNLYISENNLTSLDITQNTRLIQLVCHTNQLTALDISQNLQLEHLGISANNISNIDVSLHTQLRYLGIDSNNFTTIDVSNNILIRELTLNNNGLTNIDVSSNTNLTDLQVANNQITTLNISNNRLLEALLCSTNQLSILDISNNIRLIDFEARVNPNLTCIKVWDVDYANENWSNNIDDTASFGESCYTEIPDENFEKALIEAKIDDVIDGLVLTENAKTVKSLTLISKNIADLTGIEAFIGLTNLNVKGNNLTSIDVSQNSVLASLNVIENSLDRLDISNNKSLTVLEASANPDITCIQVWDVAYAENNWSDKIDATASFSVDCDDVWTIEVDKNVKDILTIINGIDKDNDGEITLKEAKEFAGNLDLSNKKITDIKGLQAFENIKSLNLSGNDLKDLSALTGKKITLVSKNTGKKRQVIAKASKLETLIISNNSFETLNLEELKDLKVIDLSDNPYVGTISIKNGNNAAITSFISTNTPNLSCILVDDKNANFLSSWSKDAVSNFVADIEECRSAVLSTEEFLQKDVTVYPNPVTNLLTIESTKEFDIIEVYNLIGKRVIKTSKREIDFSSFTAGIYMIKIIADSKILTKKIIKN